jgi:MFS family permease
MIHKKELKLFLSFFVMYSFFVSYINWNENSRLDLTMAVVDEHRFEIDSYYNNTGDRAFYNGHYYSDKEPGMSFLAVPVYFLYKEFFGKPVLHHNVYNQNISASYLQLMFFVIVFTSALFGAMSVVLVYRALNYFTANERHRLFITITFAMGTLVLIYSRLFINHVVAMFFAFLSFYLAFLTKRGRDFALPAGLFAGFAASTQLSTAIVALGNLVLLWRVRKRIPFYVIGCVIGLLPLLLYNYSIFHNPFEFTYFHMDKTIWGFESVNGQFKFRLAEGLNIMARLLVDPYRGLLVYSPVLIFAFIGLWLMYKKYRAEALLIASYFLVILVYNSQLNVWYGGSAFGPRHFVLLMPFLMLPLGYSFRRYKLWILLPFVAISIFINVLGLQFVQDTLFPGQPAFEQRLHSLRPISNPLLDAYLPNFAEHGLDSTLMFRALGIKYHPFVNVIILLVFCVIVWRKELLALF